MNAVHYRHWYGRAAIMAGAVAVFGCSTRRHLWPRNVIENCRSLIVSVDDVARDALQALADRRMLAFADGSRVALVEFSFGGMAALRLSSAQYAKRATPLPAFRAAIGMTRFS